MESREQQVRQRTWDILGARLGRGTIGRNAAWMLGADLATLVVTLVATPIQLEGMGSERYAIVVISAATVASLLLVDAGAGWAVLRTVPWHRARGDHDHARRLAGSALLLTSAAGAAFGVLLWFLAGDLVDLFRLSADVRAVAVRAFHVTAFLLPVLMVYGVVGALARSAGMFALQAIVVAGIGIGLNVAWALLAGRPDDVVWIVRCQVLLVALGGSLFLIALRRRARDYLFPWRPSARAARELVSFGGKVGVGQGSLMAVINVDKVGLAAILPVALLPSYSIPFSVAMRTTLVAAALVAALLPRLAAVASVGDVEETRRLGMTALRVGILASATIAVACVFAGGAFLQLWVNQGFADRAWGPLIALSLGFGLSSTGAVAHTLLDASGRAGQNAAIKVVGAGVGLALGLGLAYAFQSPLAAAIGVACGMALMGLGALELSRRTVLGIPRRTLAAAVAVPWLVLGGAGAVGFLASRAVSAPPLVTIGLVGLAAGGASALGALRTVHPRHSQ
jgi:O-antigen/teichoic acid export membrane protein